MEIRRLGLGAKRISSERSDTPRVPENKMSHSAKWGRSVVVTSQRSGRGSEKDKSETAQAAAAFFSSLSPGHSSLRVAGRSLSSPR